MNISKVPEVHLAFIPVAAAASLTIAASADAQTGPPEVQLFHQEPRTQRAGALLR